VYINKIIVFIFISIFSSNAIASPPSDKLGFHWQWDNGCINYDLHHPYIFMTSRKFGDKGGIKIPDVYTPLNYLEIWEEVFTKVHSLMPHLSPREVEWVKEELESKDTNRRIAARKTIEYSKYYLSQTVHLWLTLINSYKKEVTEDKKKKILYRFAWSLKTYSFNYANEYMKLFNKDLISSLPQKWDKIRAFKNDNMYSVELEKDWGRAYDFIMKCYIAGYK
jgi:hypothetical protein